MEIPGLNEFHASARRRVATKMEFLGQAPMGEEAADNEFRWDEVDPELVRELRRALG